MFFWKAKRDVRESGRRVFLRARMFSERRRRVKAKKQRKAWPKRASKQATMGNPFTEVYERARDKISNAIETIASLSSFTISYVVFTADKLRPSSFLNKTFQF